LHSNTDFRQVHRLAYANHLQIGIMQSLIVICRLNGIDADHVCFFDWLSARHTSFRLQDVQRSSKEVLCHASSQNAEWNLT